MGEIAVNSVEGRADPHASAGSPPPRQLLAEGSGWSVADVICRAGPRSRSFEEQFSQTGIGLVLEGSFQYRSIAGRELMAPGSLLLGNAGQYFECGHEHGIGDRCIAFTYEENYFQSIISEARLPVPSSRFPVLRIPPIRELSSLISRACARFRAQTSRAAHPRGQRLQVDAGLDSEPLRDVISETEAWEEIAVEIAVRARELAGTSTQSPENSAAAEARVTRIIRMLEERPQFRYGLSALAEAARLSRYHFLRVFQQLTGVTPHQYVLRMRLRNAATQLLCTPAAILEIALDCGFGDISNFNHAFRAEFGMRPSAYRKKGNWCIAP